MYNWSTDEEKFKQADPDGYQIWRLEQLINYGLGSEKLDFALVKKYWDKLAMDDLTRQYLEFLLWPKRPKS